MTPSSRQPYPPPPESRTRTDQWAQFRPTRSRRVPRALATVLVAAATLGSLILMARPVAAQTSSTGDWRWPLPPPVTVVAGFHPPAHPWLPGHRGVDLTASLGDEVRAAGDGIVVFAGQIGAKGVVAVRHPNGLRTTYEPLNPLVTPGQRVSRGEPIGRIEADVSHCGRPPWCLHWGLRRGIDYLDPLMLVSDRRPVLLPVTEAPAWGSAASSSPERSSALPVENSTGPTPAGSQGQGPHGSASAVVVMGGASVVGGVVISAALWNRRRRIRPSSIR